MFYVAGPQSAALDRVFVTQPDLPPLDMTVLWHMPLIVFDHALILLRLPKEMIGVGYAGACRPGESEVPSSRCCVNMPNRALFRELNYLQKAKSLVYKVCSGDVVFMHRQHSVLCWSLEVASLDNQIRSSGHLRSMPLENTPHFYFTPAAHELLLSWLEQAKNVIAVRKAAVRESFDKARYKNLQNLWKKRKGEIPLFF